MVAGLPVSVGKSTLRPGLTTRPAFVFNIRMVVEMARRLAHCALVRAPVQPPRIGATDEILTEHVLSNPHSPIRRPYVGE